jgi:hypothetical protein
MHRFARERVEPVTGKGGEELVDRATILLDRSDRADAQAAYGQR